MLIDFFVVFYDLLSIFTSVIFIVGMGIILYELCKVNGLESKSLLSFLPIGNVYIMTLLLGERVPNSIRKYLWIWYAVIYVISFFVNQLILANFIIVCYLMFLFLVEFYGNENKKTLLIHLCLGVLTNCVSFIYSFYKFRDRVIVICDESREMNNESFKDVINKCLNLLLSNNKKDSTKDNDNEEYNDNDIEEYNNNNYQSSSSSRSSSSRSSSRSSEESSNIYEDDFIEDDNKSSSFKSEIDNSNNRTGINL